MQVKSKDVMKVIKNFRKVLPMAPSRQNLNMGLSHIYIDRCGTVCCHGGWYAIATSNIGDKTSFLQGAIRMAEDLRIANNLITQWAANNPEIWGNSDGLYMFSAPYAFFHKEKRPQGARTLQDIVDHWTDVYERLKALETPEYEDITKELAVLPINETVDQVQVPV